MSDHDPAVEAWGDALGLSTSAQRVALTERYERLQADYNAVLLEQAGDRASVLNLIAQRDSANQRWADVRIQAENLAEDLTAARAEIARLTARIARQPGAYHLTDKDLAATEANDG